MDDNENFMKSLDTMVEISETRKKKMLEYIRRHAEYDPILRHDIIHYCMMTESIPLRYDDESDFDYKTRLLYFRRRMDEQNRLAGCIMRLIEMNNKENKNEDN